MESEFLNFELSEFQVLEDIEFDETIQRPEKVRFYTLEEQTVDAFERLLPKGRVTKYQIRELEKEIRRVKELYEEFVVSTLDDYKLREASYSKKFSWVYPVYATDELKPYSFSTSWTPLYDNVNQPNYYPRMISSLPSPFADAPDGDPYPVVEVTEFLDADGQTPRRALPDYLTTRTQRHEDGTIDIIRVPIASTADSVQWTGYYLAKRALNIPNPLLEHPFLKSNEPTYIETTAPFEEVAPSMDAILTHGVPVTKDPYREAKPYLKLYDIHLQDIPWVSWKAKFPPVDVVGDITEQILIEFPKGQELKPSDNIVEEYKSAYTVGLSSRKWLMDQPDGGRLVVAMLLSKAIENGSVASIPGIDLPLAGYPQTTIEECELLGRTFQEFTVQGSLRRTWKWDAKKEKDDIKLECIPLEFVKQERARNGYAQRLPWKESTGNEILDAYRRKLVGMHPIEKKLVKSIAEAITRGKSESPLRKELLLVQADHRRFTEDKVRDIQDLLKTSSVTLTNNLYTDPEGSFAFCSHTLAVLSGDFAKDRRAFYDKWTSIDDGFRVCKFCGERVSTTDYVDQTEFDEDGFVMKRTDVVEEKVFHAESIAGFTTGLRALQPLFKLDDAMDATCFLLLSILQVLPSADQIDPLLQFARTFLTKQYGSKKSDDVIKIKGVMGICVVIILLQTHTPRILPRRSFGNRPLQLQGFPRDAADPEGYSILDSMILVIRKTFEAYPTSFKGPSNQVIRAILAKPTDVKNNITVLLKKVFLVDLSVKRSLARAKEEQSTLPAVEQPETLIPFVLPAPTNFDVIKTLAECPSGRPILSAGEEVQVSQRSVPLRSRIVPDKDLKVLPPSLSSRVSTKIIEKSVIRSMFKKDAKIAWLQDDYLTNIVIASRLADIFLLPNPTLQTVDSGQNPDELRDIAKGFVFEIWSQIQSDPVKRATFEELKTKDVTLYSAFSDFKEEKANVNKLRAQERLRFVEEMGRRSDQEREILRELLRIGVAPYIITNRDREAFAKEAQQLSDAAKIDEDTVKIDEEIGVGVPQDAFDQGDVPVQGAEGGNYGDYYAQPGNDGRDHDQATFWDDTAPPI